MTKTKEELREALMDASCSLAEVFALCSRVMVDRRVCPHTQAFAAWLLANLVEHGWIAASVVDALGSDLEVDVH